MLDILAGYKRYFEILRKMQESDLMFKLFKRKTISYFVVVSIDFKERIYRSGTCIFSGHHFGKVNDQFAFMILF